MVAAVALGVNGGGNGDWWWWWCIVVAEVLGLPWQLYAVSIGAVESVCFFTISEKALFD